ncbi:hypothetical protein ES703_48214 [subsurface metagenome]
MVFSRLGRLKDWAIPPVYKVSIRILVPGCNIHKEIKARELPYEIEIEGKNYKVGIEDVYKIKHSFIKRPLYWLMGIKGRYLCIFRSSEDGEPIKNIETQATPVLIRNVKKSRILGKALAEIFKSGMGGSVKFILIMLAVGIALYIAVQQGLIG